ncbi:branched-chain amino acid transport system II carrier protein [Edwardsiella ictaluri]
MVANVGLSRLIALSVPVLMALYPLAIALVVLTFIRRWLRNPVVGYRLVMLVALLCSLMDGARAAGAESGWLGELLAWQMRTMPLAADGMAWVLPSTLALLVALLLPAGARNAGAPQAA